MHFRQKSLSCFTPPLFIALVITLFLAAAAAGARGIMRVSTDAAGGQGDGNSATASVSADGRYVAFYAEATNLVLDDGNGYGDVFLKDTQTGMIIRVSTDSEGGQGNGSSWYPSVSADGRYVAFESLAANLVPSDTNSRDDIFLKDISTGRTTRISTGSDGRQGSARSGYPSISADGRYVAFSSLAHNLVSADVNGTWDVLVKDTATGQTAMVSSNSSGQAGNSWSYFSSVSADGRYVAYHSNASNLVEGDTNGTVDIFVKDTVTGRTFIVSTDSAGSQGNGESWCPSISADGRYVAFFSNASNLVPGDNNGTWDVFWKDTLTGQTIMASSDSAGSQGNSWSITPSISADGRYVTFASYASNLVEGDSNKAVDIIVKDISSGRTTRVSTDSAGGQGNNHSYRPSISTVGGLVAFESLAANLLPDDTNNKYDVFLSAVCFGSKPDLSFSLARVYWASYDDFLFRRLSLDFGVTNVGSDTAYEVEINSSMATNNANVLTTIPISLGNIAGGSSHVVTLQYKVPLLVQNFETNVHATGRDECNNLHEYEGRGQVQVPLLPPVS